MGTIIGIDLGTSTTEAAVFKDGKPCMIPGFEKQVVMPSAVGIDDSGNYVIGARARDQYILSPERTAIEIKRKIGSDETIKLGFTSHTPVDLSAMILKHVRQYASEYLNEEITRAVISVPAYFDDHQRQATVEAGKKAGFTVERILNEPTAAALGYGMEHMEEESYVLVYDLGGGTFDVTLLEMFGGVMEVKASSGDNQLGGKDFDERLIQWLLDQFYQKHGKHLQEDIYAMVKLKEQAEICKIELSTHDSYRISIPFITEKDGMPLAMEETVTTELFEGLIKDLLHQTHHPIDVVLADSEISPSQINRILLVGGSTKIPAVRRDIEEYLSIKPSFHVNPDYAVAEGAAIQAGIIEGSVSQENSIIMTDVNPFTLGVRVFDGMTNDCMSVMIPRNVTIPVKKKNTYSTSCPGQEEASIEVYQGESRTTSRNHFLGKFTIKGIPPGPEGEEKIEVSFAYDQNGILVVSAIIISTREEASIEINMMDNQKSADQRVDVSKWKEAPSARRFRTVVRRAEQILKNKKVAVCDEELYEELDDLLYLLKKALIEDDDNVDWMEQELLDLMEEFEA